MKSIIVNLVIATVLVLAITNCTDKDQLTNSENTFESILAESSLAKLSDVEDKLDTLSMIMANLIGDSLVSPLLTQEININIEYDTIALWDVINTKTLKGVVTLRSKIESELVTLGYSATGSKEFTKSIDDIGWVQFYMYNFDNWDKESATPSTYVPVTQDDLKTNYLTFYSDTGKAIIDVSDMDWSPAYPVLVVGLEELYYGSKTLAKNISLGKSSSATMVDNDGIFIHKIKVRRPRTLESWFCGKADMVVKNPDQDCSGGAKVANKKDCNIFRTGSFFAFWGTGKGDWQLSETASSSDMVVYEKDALFDDHIIDEGTITHSGSSWTETASDYTDYYTCGGLVRCDYEWSWGTDMNQICGD